MSEELTLMVFAHVQKSCATHPPAEATFSPSLVAPTARLRRRRFFLTCAMVFAGLSSHFKVLSQL
jgi:hypothetical protein